MELMSLKIPTGFAVCYNKFYDVEPIMPESNDDIIKNWGFFTEDLLQIVKMDIKNGSYYIPREHFLIDLGWSPDADPKGSYCLHLVMVKNDHSWEEIKKNKTTNRFVIQKTIEDWLQELL